MDHETAGDPLSGRKWTRRTTAKVAAELCKLGTDVCARTVARLLQKMGFSLRVNHKKRAGASHPNRDDQFQHIAELRERCADENTPVISVDTKKKELVGAFRNPGAKWDHSPELVNDHDFPSAAEGRAIPYGIYDPRANAGTVFVGQTADTPAFAVDCIEKWWRTEGHKHYSEAEALQVLADGGGSNSCTARAWKFNLQHHLCNRHRLRVTVAHYPPATSKWNPIEHRLFCEVSKNWAGRPLDSYETILKYLRTTRTATGWRKSGDPHSTGSIEFRTLDGMAMGKKPAARQPSPMWVTTADLPTNAGHPFFERLNRVLEEAGFDAFVEGLCGAFYAARMGRPSLRPGRYFRLLFIGYFEGLSSERGIAWRVADSLSLRSFLDLDVTEAAPDHSTLSRTRRLIDVETHVAVVRQANWRRMAGESPAEGRTNDPPSPRVMRRSLRGGR